MNRTAAEWVLVGPAPASSLFVATYTPGVSNGPSGPDASLSALCVLFLTHVGRDVRRHLRGILSQTRRL